jgi:hypothetical protein
MLQSYSLFDAENVSPASIESSQKFIVEEALWTTVNKKNNDLYKQIVYKVSRNPKHLISHIQRFYFTYGMKQKDPLYASLADLLLTLGGNGKQLSNRLILSARSVLTDQQYQNLMSFSKTQNIHLLLENNYTVLTQGLIGTTHLVEAVAEKVEN